MPPDAVDAALFGQEKKPVTGAFGPEGRWFERTDGGTLFLDEIGGLPPTSQVRLLRVLQEGTFERVGGRQSIQVDIRIIAATQRDLAAMVQRGLFRQDLWYRMAAFPIVLPPLRERPEDIPALAAHFAQRAAVRFGLTSQPLGPDDISRLNGYGWPGNVRELAVVIERAVMLGGGKSLEIATALGVSSDSEDLLQRHHETGYVPRHVASVPVPLDVAMKQHIEAALTLTQGRVEGPHGAARLLKINPYTLRGRMRKLRIDWHMFRAVREDL
jgi:transcriptional regulator with GAF, ATPase, and Fis domain